MNNKNSILRRAIPNNVKSHLESVDVDYERQVQRDEARRARKEALRSHLVKHFYPTEEERLEARYVPDACIATDACRMCLQSVWIGWALFVCVAPWLPCSTGFR